MSQKAPGERLRVLVVTAGHPFESEPFFAMFDADDGIRRESAEQHHVSVLDPAHPVCQGVEDGFELTGELHLVPILEDSVGPLLRTDAHARARDNRVPAG